MREQMSEQSSDEQPPEPPNESQFQQHWSDADRAAGGTGEVYAMLADTANNVRDQYCFYWDRSDGTDVMWFRMTLCAKTTDALNSLLPDIVERLQKAGWPVSYAVRC
jgi:hypothetical protein